MKLPPEIESAVASLMVDKGGVGSIELMAVPRLVADHVDKAIVFAPDARPTFLVMMASAEFPDCVRDAFARAAAARHALGSDAGIASAVQVAVVEGMAAGRSFAIVSYLSPVARGRLRGRWDRFRLREPAFEWLREVTRRTVAIPPAEALDAAFLQPLNGLSRMQAAGERVRGAARDSLAALEGGRWQPRWVLAHNDFWLGNFLFRRPETAGHPGFAVIDWGASRVRGYPAYDFASFASSFKLSDPALRRRLGEYCEALGCEPAQARHHLVAALAGLSTALGHWPVERFAAAAERYLALMERAA
jgi:hypothetical protein